jgi:uncharacterized protein (TIGR03067 family)
MIKALSILLIRVAATIIGGYANIGGTTAESPAAQREYELLSGTWQLTRGVVNGKAVPASVARNTIVITDRNTFRFPKASSVGTHSAGHFTVNPNTTPKQVDSIADDGPNAGQVTAGFMRFPIRPSALAGARPMVRVRQSLSHFREADGSFNIERRLGRCRRAKV